MLYILSWFFGIGAMLSLFFLYQQQSRRKLLTCKFCADVCWVFHYLCLGAVGGAIPNFVGIFRELVFVKREEKEWANHTAWPIGFIAVNFALGLASFRTPINLLPISASALVTISLWLRKPVLTKLVSVPVSAVFLLYDVLVGSWIGVVNESIAILSIFFSLKQTRKK